MQRENEPVAYPVAQYGDFTEKHVELYDNLMIRRLLEISSEYRKNTVLVDVGSGTASLLRQMASYFPCVLIGLDFFPSIVEEAQKRINQAKLSSKIHIIRGDVHALPFPANSVDFVISRSTVHHWRNPVAAFREIFRVLSYRGFALIHDIRKDADPDALEHFNSQRALNDLPASKLDDKYTGEEIQEILHEAGIWEFSSIQVPISGPYSLGYEVLIRKS